MATALVFSTSVYAASITGQGTWETTLQGRSFDDNPKTVEVYYDTILDITWLADANVSSVPRGRVIYFKNKSVFKIYMDKVLFSKANKKTY